MDKVRLIVMCGMPGSGKSTYAMKLAKQYNARIVSSDRIREKMFGDALVQKDGDKVFKKLFGTAWYNLHNKQSVIIDCVNPSKRDRARYIQRFQELFEESILVYVDTSYEVCCKRNKARDRVVPDYAMERIFKKFNAPIDEEGYDKLVVHK